MSKFQVLALGARPLKFTGSIPINFCVEKIGGGANVPNKATKEQMPPDPG